MNETHDGDPIDIAESRAMRLPDPPPPPPPLVSPFLNDVSSSMGIGALSGSIAGLVWGGIGGRIAMRIAFLTSPDGVRGATSDDGFEIGVISFATFFLLVFASTAGAVGGVVYGLLRPFLGGRRWLTATGVAVASASGIGGGLIIDDRGIDFRLLGPLGLLIAMFLILPAAWGATVVYLTDVVGRAGFVSAPASSRRDARYGGIPATATAWLLMAAITVAGLRDLWSNVDRLT